MSLSWRSLSLGEVKVQLWRGYTSHERAQKATVPQGRVLPRSLGSLLCARHRGVSELSPAHPLEDISIINYPWSSFSKWNRLSSLVPRT